MAIVFFSPIFIMDPSVIAYWWNRIEGRSLEESPEQSQSDFGDAVRAWADRTADAVLAAVRVLTGVP